MCIGLWPFPGGRTPEFLNSGRYLSAFIGTHYEFESRVRGASLEFFLVILRELSTFRPTNLPGTLLQIIEKAVHAFQERTGETLDLSLIKAEGLL
jgi:hypothetical protein